MINRHKFSTFTFRCECVIISRHPANEGYIWRNVSVQVLDLISIYTTQKEVGSFSRLTFTLKLSAVKFE